jgi:curved DNA-binding protein CbpA
MDTSILKKDLLILELEEKELDEVTIKDVIKAYRKKALRVHPDKAGKESTAAFQELNNSYERVLKYLVENYDSSENDVSTENEDEDEKFTKENFHSFNFPKEKEKSFVVQVQNDLADAWSECFQKKYGIPTINKTNNGVETGRKWKVPYFSKELTIRFIFITSQKAPKSANFWCKEEIM